MPRAVGLVNVPCQLSHSVFLVFKLRMTSIATEFISSIG